MPVTLTAQRTAVSVEKLLDVIVGLISEAMGGRDTVASSSAHCDMARQRRAQLASAHRRDVAYDPGDVLQCNRPCRSALRSR